MAKRRKKKRKKSSRTKSLFLNKLLLILYIPALMFTFFNTYDEVYDEKIDLNGDNISYYILGKSLASGEGYRDIHKIDKPRHNHYPPGYPVILAGALQIFPDDVDILKTINGMFLLLSVGMLYFILYRLTGNIHIPFITALFVLLNVHLLRYSFIMMSEIPFLMFSTLSILLLVMTDFKAPLRNNWLFFALLICISFTYHIRSTGIALFFGILMFLLLRKNWRYLGALFGGFILLGLPWYLRSMSLGGSTYMGQLTKKNPYRPELGTMDLGDWINRIWINFERYITREIPAGTFNFFEVSNYQDPVQISEWLIGIPVVIVILFGLFRLRKYFYLLLFYFIASFGILLLWPDVWFGPRFLLPLVPFLFFFFVYGLAEMVHWSTDYLLRKKYTTAINIGLVILSLFFIRGYMTPLKQLELKARADYPVHYQNYFDMAKWVEKNGSEQSVTCCRKGQLFYFFSNRYVTGFKNTKNSEQLIENLKKKGTDYVVLDQLGYSDTRRYLYPAIKAYPNKFPIIKQKGDPKTYLMEFRPER